MQFWWVAYFINMWLNFYFNEIEIVNGRQATWGKITIFMKVFEILNGIIEDIWIVCFCDWSMNHFLENINTFLATCQMQRF